MECLLSTGLTPSSYQSLRPKSLHAVYLSGQKVVKKKSYRTTSIRVQDCCSNGDLIYYERQDILSYFLGGVPQLLSCSSAPQLLPRGLQSGRCSPGNFLEMTLGQRYLSAHIVGKSYCKKKTFKWTMSNKPFQ